MCILRIVDSILMLFFFFFKQKTAYEMRISDWSSDVCSSDLAALRKNRDYDRCRRRWRAYRDLADDLLLPGNARHRARGARLSGAAPALSADFGQHLGLCTRRRASCRA